VRLNGCSVHAKSTSSGHIWWGGKDGARSFALESNTYISTFGMSTRVLIITNVAVLYSVDSVIFSDADILARMPFRACWM
jgi:hypothetical protein